MQTCASKTIISNLKIKNAGMLLQLTRGGGWGRISSLQQCGSYSGWNFQPEQRVSEAFAPFQKLPLRCARPGKRTFPRQRGACVYKGRWSSCRRLYASYIQNVQYAFQDMHIAYAPDTHWSNRAELIQPLSFTLLLHSSLI